MFVFASLIASVHVLALHFQPLGLLQSSPFPTELPASVTGERLPRHRNCLATVSDRAAVLTKHSNVICAVISVAQDAGRTAARAASASAAVANDEISNVTPSWEKLCITKNSVIELEDQPR